LKSRLRDDSRLLDELIGPNLVVRPHRGCTGLQVIDAVAESSSVVRLREHGLDVEQIGEAPSVRFGHEVDYISLSAVITPVWL